MSTTGKPSLHLRNKSEFSTTGITFSFPPGIKILLPDVSGGSRKPIAAPETPHAYGSPRSQLGLSSFRKIKNPRNSKDSAHNSINIFQKGSNTTSNSSLNKISGFNQTAYFSSTRRRGSNSEKLALTDRASNNISLQKNKFAEENLTPRPYILSPIQNGKVQKGKRIFQPFPSSPSRIAPQTEDEKVSGKLVRQLKEAIKRTKHDELEDQLNLEEQRELEIKIKRDLFPQIAKIKQRERKSSNASSTSSPQKYNINLECPSPRNGILSRDEISIELLTIIRIMQNRSEYLSTLKLMNKEKSIEIMVDLLKLAIELDDVDVFLDAMDMMAQTALMFSDYKLAIIVLNMMKITCDMTHNTAKKIPLYRMYSLVCKKLGFYEYSLCFLKKALQYIWLEDDKDAEIQIYDDLGIIFFHMVQLEQAKICHEKSVQSFNEPVDNILREMSSRNLMKLKVNFNPQLKNIEQQLMHKLLQSPLIFVKRDPEDGPVEMHVENVYMRKNNLRLCKNISSMNSTSSEAVLIQQAIQSSEFSEEITMPLSRPKEISSLDFVRMKKVNDHFIYFEERELKKGKSEQKFMYPKQLQKKEFTTFYLEDEKKKMDLGEKIKLRIKQFDQDIKNKDKTPVKMEGVKKEVFDTINIGHLTTNRSVDAFTQAISINYVGPNKFYDKIISSQYSKHSHMQNPVKSFLKEKLI